MVMEELRRQLVDAGKKLLDPPAHVEELLRLLDLTESLLAKVGQSPDENISISLYHIMEALISEQLLHHADKDVKVHVASCLSEISRITAPCTPYNDELMERIFQVIVEIFESLDDISSRSYSKKVSILETIAKVRSCILMLDLDCDDMIVQMFYHFLDNIGKIHSKNVFASMENIMTIILDEIDDISSDLVFCLLDSVKRNNKVFPNRFALAKRVIRNCGESLKPHIRKIFQANVASLAEYSEIITKIYDEMEIQIKSNASDKYMGSEKKKLKARLAENRSSASVSTKLHTSSPSKTDKLEQSGKFVSKRKKLNEKAASPVKSNLSSVKSLERESDHKPHSVKPLSLNEESDSRLPVPLGLNSSTIYDSKPDTPSRRKGRPLGSKNRLKSQDKYEQKLSKTELVKEVHSSKGKCKEGEAPEYGNPHDDQSNADVLLTMASRLKHDESQKDEQLTAEVIGSRIKVWWPMDRKFYRGTIESYDDVTMKHKVLYDDGDVEELLLKNERWKFVDDKNFREERNKPNKRKNESQCSLEMESQDTERQVLQHPVNSLEELKSGQGKEQVNNSTKSSSGCTVAYFESAGKGSKERISDGTMLSESNDLTKYETNLVQSSEDKLLSVNDPKSQGLLEVIGCAAEHDVAERTQTEVRDDDKF